MGWLGGEDKTYVGTSVSRAIKDEAINPSWKTGALKALSNHGDITDYVSEELISNLGIKGKQYYNYGKRHYPYGLPSGQINTPTQGQEAVEAILESLENAGVVLAYSFYGGINYGHLAWKQVDATYQLNGFNELQTLSVKKGSAVTLQSVALVMSEATRNALPGSAIRPLGKPFLLVQDNAQSGIAVQITYSWFSTQTVPASGDTPGYNITTVIEESTRVALALTDAGFNPGDNYFQAAYLKGSDTRYWEYRIGAGTYPELDSIFDTAHTPLGSYFPFGYFRYEKVSMKDPSQEEGYAASKKMMKKLGIDYDAMIDSIHENPDIKDVEQALLFMAVPPSTSNMVEQEYLFRYFSSLFSSLNGQVTELSQEGLAQSLLTNGLPLGATVVIEDTRFKMALDHRGLFKRQVDAVFGPVGTYTSGTTTVYESVAYTTYLGEGESRQESTQLPFLSHWYKKQVSATQYEEIQVLGLAMMYYIEPNGSRYWHTTTGTGQDPILLVPLDLAVVDRMSLRKREELYSRAMHYVFNSLTVVHLKWYQTELFADLLLFAAIVFTIVTLGQGYASLEAAVALGAMTVAEAVAYVAMQALVYIGKMVVTQLFVKAVGVKIAFIVAIIAIATGVYRASGTDTLKDATKSLTVMGVNLVEVVNNLTGAINNSIKADFLDLRGEISEFDDYKKASMQLLEDAEKLLEKDTTLMCAIIPGESIGDLVQRTTYGNIGTVALDAIHNYVERSLALPTFNDTMGRKFNG